MVTTYTQFCPSLWSVIWYLKKKDITDYNYYYYSTFIPRLYGYGGTTVVCSNERYSRRNKLTKNLKKIGILYQVLICPEMTSRVVRDPFLNVLNYLCVSNRYCRHLFSVDSFVPPAVQIDSFEVARRRRVEYVDVRHVGRVRVNVAGITEQTWLMYNI